MSFLRKLLPKNGLYHVALKQKDGVIPSFHATVEEATSRIEAMDAKGMEVYLAQASFKEPTNRKQTNALGLRAFFFDVDCGEDKPYADQKEAAAALTEFEKATGLPKACVVSSGYGLYAYWFVEEDIPAEQWKQFGRMLKSVAAEAKFHIDPVRTADSSSILRPPGATNRKYGTTKPVSLVRNAAPIPNDEFITLLERAAKRFKIDRSALQPPKRSDDINSEFLDGITDGPPSSAHAIAEKCPQIREIRDTEGNVEEPLWYAGLGLLRYTEEAPAILHEWSKGHPEYSAAATDAKIQQLEESGTGPTTCAHLGGIRHDLCTACPFKNEIKSPIVLGRAAPKQMELEPEELQPPEGFTRTAQGLVYTEDGVHKSFYDQDLYPVWLAYDEGEGFEVAMIRHTTPKDGTKEFLLRSSLVADPKALHVKLMDNHVKVLGHTEKKYMTAYVEGYMKKLQAHRSMKKMLTQMGWREFDGELVFVLGQKVFHKGGTVDDAALSMSVPDAVKAFGTTGDPNLWIEQTKKLNAPGMEAHAFTLLAGAFGAPLMRFTGFDGAMISTVGPSGSGKTLMARWAQSAYGDHARLMMLRDDTRNSLVSRLGTYGSLPLTIDEVTNIGADELSDLVYRVTQGRDKARLGRNAVERSCLNYWNTLAVVSSNESLYGKLASLKCDSSAELNRLFEYTVPKVPTFNRESATEVFRVISGNFGHVGEQFVKHLAEHADIHQAKIDQLSAKIDAATNAQADERFWSAIAAVAIYGGLIARNLGLIKFDVAPVYKWVVETIKEMREGKEDVVRDSVSLLGQFLDENAKNRLIIRTRKEDKKILEPQRGIGNALNTRLEIDTYQLYISVPVFRQWMSQHYGDFNKFRHEMIEMKALRPKIKRKSLGAGTDYSGTAQRCLQFDLSNPMLGHVHVKLVGGADGVANDAIAGI